MNEEILKHLVGLVRESSLMSGMKGKRVLCCVGNRLP
jgi:hypothetical protein